MLFERAPNGYDVSGVRVMERLAERGLACRKGQGYRMFTVRYGLTHDGRGMAQRLLAISSTSTPAPPSDRRPLTVL